MGMTLLPMVPWNTVESAIVRSGADGDDAGRFRTLGSGGQGTVYSLDADFTVRGQRRLVYKEYHKSQLCGHEVALRLLWDRIIQRLDELERRNPQYAKYTQMVRQCTAWPVAVVEQDGMACGVLEPVIDGAWLNPHGLDGATGMLESWMLPNTPQGAKNLADRGMTPLSPLERASAAYQIMHGYALLHWMGFVIGDVGPKNIMAFFPSCAGDGTDGIRVCLLEMETLRENECGAVFFIGDSPNFEAPEREDDDYVNTQSSDVYKAALLVVRLFAQEEKRPLLVQSVTDSIRESLRDAGLDKTIVTTLEGCLNNRPENRPTMMELASVFPAP